MMNNPIHNDMAVLKQSEFVRGVIIGGDLYRWTIAYDGRDQMTFHQYAYSEAEAEELGRAEIARIKVWCGQALYLIHPHNTWEVRIWSPS